MRRVVIDGARHQIAAVSRRLIGRDHRFRNAGATPFRRLDGRRPYRARTPLHNSTSGQARVHGSGQNR